MREIKFRAWTRWGMVYPDHSLITIDVNARMAWKDTADDENISIMQYTGLKDKNDIEIYEGDILKSRHGGKWQIAYDEKGLVWSLSDERGIAQMRITPTRLRQDGFEIIGNIYENPKLLEEPSAPKASPTVQANIKAKS